MRMASRIITPDPGKAAELRASFTAAGGRTVLAGKYHTAPLKIAKAFPLEHQLGVIMMDVSPGLLDRDCYELIWDADTGACVHLTNQSYTKVHPCQPDSRAIMKQSFRLGEHSVVESMMEPVMLYMDAALYNETNVELKPGAVWMQSEVLCPGRVLRGERFRYRELDNRLRVYYDGELIFAQRQRVIPALHQIEGPGAWEGYSHLGTFYCFSDAVRPGHAGEVRIALESCPVRPGREVKTGVSLTSRHGLAVMVAGNTAWEVQKVLLAAWQAVRRLLLGWPPLRFRK